MIEKELPVLQENFFNQEGVLPWERIPPQDELFIGAWEEYVKEAASNGGFAVLRERLLQLQFPVQDGISFTEAYRRATLKGLDVGSKREVTGTLLEAPAEVKLELYQTWAGKIPIIFTSNRADFVTLVRVLAHKNEPVSIPPSMGACLVKGFNNWDRIKKYRAEWERKVGGSFNQDILWNLEFQRIKSSRQLYQERFLILTDNEYSNVPAEMLGLMKVQWRHLSYIIRREHEATHYYTLRFMGSAKNHLLDEFIADYMGIVAACGQYKAQWFLCFLGLENSPTFRPEGRLANYLQATSLSEEAFALLIQYIVKAAVNVESFSNKYGARIYSAEGRYRMLLAMSKLNLTMLASEDAEGILLKNGLDDFCTKEV